MKQKIILATLVLPLLFLTSCKKFGFSWMQPDDGPNIQPASIVCTGNHITFGPGLDSADRYPVRLGLQLVERKGFVNVTVTEKGEQPFARIGAMTHQIKERIDPYKNHNGKNIVIVTEFTDDMRENHQTVESSIRFMEDYCDSLHAHGWIVYTSTTPYQNPFYGKYSSPFPDGDALVTPSAYDSSEYIAQLNAINDSLRVHWPEFADGLVDAGADVRLQQYDPQYFMVNHVDLTKKGAEVFSELATAQMTVALGH